MRLHFLRISFLLLTGSFAFGTAQRPDYLKISGDEVPLHSNALERYFKIHPELRPKSRITSSSLWRGYIAYFEIRDSALFLNDLTKMVSVGTKKKLEYEWRSAIDDSFPQESQRMLDWYTGFLIIPQGDLVNYVHMGYASEYEGYRLLFVKNGLLIADRIFSAKEYAKYKRIQFKAFSKTDRFKKMNAELSKEYGKKTTVSIEHFLFIFDTTFPTEILINYKDFRPNESPDPI